jgi:hypothetical protein
MRNGDLESADSTSPDELELELAELVEEAHQRMIWRRLHLAAITVALTLVALSVYVIAWGS